MASAQAETVRRIMIDLGLGEQFDQEDRRKVLTILVDLIERVEKLERAGKASIGR